MRVGINGMGRIGRLALRASRVIEKTPSVELIEVAAQPV